MSRLLSGGGYIEDQPMQPFQNLLQQALMPQQQQQVAIPSMNPAQNQGMDRRKAMWDVLGAIGMGLATGNPGTSAQMFQQMSQQREERKQRDMANNASAQYLKAQKAEHLIPLVQSGQMTMMEAIQLARGGKAATPYTDAAKAKADLDSGYITEEQYRQFLAPPQPDMETEQKLRKEYNSYDPVKQYSTIRDSYERVRASAERAQADTTGASDMAMIFNYMKMLDPGSVVRETEFENAAKSGGYGPRIQNLVQQITSGKMLTPQQRDEFVKTAEKLYGEASQNVVSANERYGPIADQHRIDRSRVLIEPEKYEPLQIGQTIQVSPDVTMRRTR